MRLRVVSLVEAVNLVAGAPPSAPLSLQVGPGQIVALLFPPGKPRAPVLRVLAGLDAAVSGDVRFPTGGRIAIATTGQALRDALSLLPDLVALDAGNDEGDHNGWARLASERGLGTSFLIATTNLNEACRCDTMMLISWDMRDLMYAMADLLLRMSSQTEEFLGALGEAQGLRIGQLAADLLRLNLGARALLAEMRRLAHAGDEVAAWHIAMGQVAAVSLNDRVLGVAAAEAQDR